MQVVAIAGDPLAKMQNVAKQFPGFIFLSDANGVPVSQTWGAAEPDDDVPTPATFVVDPDGSIRFSHHSGIGQGEWPTWDQIAAALR